MVVASTPSASCWLQRLPARPDSLETMRARIDALDMQIAQLLQERAAVSLRVGQTKSGADSAPIFVQHREAEVLSNVQRVGGPLDGQALASIYREILSTSRALQRPTRVAHLGPMATFGHQAAVDRFGSAAELEPCQTHAEVIAMVEKGAADYGLVAFENSTEGPVNEVLDRFLETPLQICAEVSLPIAHTLLSRATSLSTIKRVLSHPQAAGQTRLWLAEHLPRGARLPATHQGKTG